MGDVADVPSLARVNRACDLTADDSARSTLNAGNLPAQGHADDSEAEQCIEGDFTAGVCVPAVNGVEASSQKEDASVLSALSHQTKLLEQQLAEMRQSHIFAEAAVAKERERAAADCSRIATLAARLAQLQSSGVNKEGEKVMTLEVRIEQLERNERANAELLDRERISTLEERISQLESNRLARLRQGRSSRHRRTNHIFPAGAEKESRFARFEDEEAMPGQEFDQRQKHSPGPGHEKVRGRSSCIISSSSSSSDDSNFSSHEDVRAGADRRGFDFVSGVRRYAHVAAAHAAAVRAKQLKDRTAPPYALQTGGAVDVHRRRKALSADASNAVSPCVGQQSLANEHTGDDGQGAIRCHGGEGNDTVMQTQTTTASEDVAVRVVKKRILFKGFRSLGSKQSSSTSVKKRIWTKSSYCLRETITQTKTKTKTKMKAITKIPSSSDQKRVTTALAVKPKARPTTPRRFNSQKRQPCARQSGVCGVKFDKNKTRWVACFWQGGELLTGRFRYTKYLHLVGGKEDAAIQMAMKDAISFRQRGPASGVGGYSGLPVVPGGKPHLAIEDVRPSGSGKSGDKHGASDGVPARRSSAVAKRSLVLKRKRPNLKVKVKRKPLKATDSKSVQQKDNAGKVKVWSAKPKVAWAKRRVSSTGKAPPAKRAARIVVKRTTGFRTKLPVKKVRKGSKRKSGVKGVQWDSRRLTWRPYIQYEGKMLRGPSVRPKDQSEEQVEKARVIAMKNRDTLERSFKGSIRRT
eukprot:TRINITY_DN14395_c0_g1_i4.p1 TRINITY_DN14395_c0_g1~~TRINITY_DN14395_c0_g1_i4.p1  ORF type:complete len:750 (+),score=141.14 TRINITY_DN14395_c0_g1_i4:78-2327(+)